MSTTLLTTKVDRIIAGDFSRYQYRHAAASIITCADGFSLSVIAHQFTYRIPALGDGPFTHVEVGFPSERPEPWDVWRKYADDENDPTETVYGYVPVELVRELITSHGGEVA